LPEVWKGTNTVANLIAITYPGTSTAKSAMERVDWAAFDKQIDVIDACWMASKDGEVTVHPGGHPKAAKAALGGGIGLVVGALFGLPVVGLAAGAALGAHRAGKTETELDNEFVESIKSQVASGGSAIVVLYEDGADTERAGADLLEFGGSVQSTTIPYEQLVRIQADLDRENGGA
jgi:uncharacterized membrane protein